MIANAITGCFRQVIPPLNKNCLETSQSHTKFAVQIYFSRTPRFSFWYPYGDALCNVPCLQWGTVNAWHCAWLGHSGESWKTCCVVVLGRTTGKVENPRGQLRGSVQEAAVGAWVSPDRTMATATEITTPKSTPPEMSGFLLKWTNYLKGYQRRWFVLSNGVLSYYRYTFRCHMSVVRPCPPWVSWPGFRRFICIHTLTLERPNTRQRQWLGITLSIWSPIRLHL